MPRKKIKPKKNRKRATMNYRTLESNSKFYIISIILAPLFPTALGFNTLHTWTQMGLKPLTRFINQANFWHVLDRIHCWYNWYPTTVRNLVVWDFVRELSWLNNASFISLTSFPLYLSYYSWLIQVSRPYTAFGKYNAIGESRVCLPNFSAPWFNGRSFTPLGIFSFMIHQKVISV